MQNRQLAKAQSRLKELGLDRRYSAKLSESPQKNKRFAVHATVGGQQRRIHFGAWPVSRGTFLDHEDVNIRAAWRARHRVGNPQAYDDPASPLFWAARILW